MISQKLYFDVGTPENHANVSLPLLLTPKLYSINTHQGSAGGSTITAHIPGIITGQEDITTLVDSDGDTICQSVSIPEYGVLLCDTLEDIIAEGTQISVKQDEVIYDCVNPDLTLCQYQ